MTPTTRLTYETSVFFDGACPICIALARFAGEGLARRGFRLIPLQSPRALAALRMSEAEALEEMRVLTPEGRLIGGADAMLHVVAAFAWARPMAWLLGVPPLRPLLRRAYRAFARRRYCLGAQCRLAASAQSTLEREITS